MAAPSGEGNGEGASEFASRTSGRIRRWVEPRGRPGGSRLPGDPTRYRYRSLRSSAGSGGRPYLLGASHRRSPAITWTISRGTPIPIDITACGRSISSAAIQPPHSKVSRTITSGCQRRPISTRSSTIPCPDSSAKILTCSSPCISVKPGNVRSTSASVQSRPAGNAVNPKASTSGVNEGALATATSWPAPVSEAASRAAGWRCPIPGWMENSTRIGASLASRCGYQSDFGFRSGGARQR